MTISFEEKGKSSRVELMRDVDQDSELFDASENYPFDDSQEKI
jgi:hypothetical protein